MLCKLVTSDADDDDDYDDDYDDDDDNKRYNTRLEHALLEDLLADTSAYLESEQRINDIRSRASEGDITASVMLQMGLTVPMYSMPGADECVDNNEDEDDEEKEEKVEEVEENAPGMSSRKRPRE